MKGYKNFLTADLAIQSIIMGVPLVFILVGLFSGSFFGLFIGLYALFFIGVWQVISGIVLAAIFKDRLRAWYLLGVTGFFALASLVSFLVSEISVYSSFRGLYLLIWIVIPIGIACWYYFITYSDQKEAKEKLKTFWDL